MQNKQITIYNRDTRLNATLLEAFQSVLHDAWSFRELIWSNIKRDLTAPYKQSYLGIFWSFLVPIIPITAYIFLGFMRVLNVDGGIPYALYIMTGMTIWSVFSGGIRNMISRLQGQRGIITKIKVPMVVVFLSGFGVVLSDTVIRLFFVMLALIFYEIVPSATIIFLPVLLLPFVLLSLGLGIILSFLNTVTKDTGNIVNLLLTYGTFASSVLFPMPTTGLLGKINLVNIPNHFVVALRDFIVLGQVNNWDLYLVASLISVIIFIVSIKILFSLEYMVVGHL